MSNGPAHYAAAEELIADARTEFGQGNDAHAALLIAEAEVRATLALAAATAAPHMGTAAIGDWNTVSR